MESNAMTRWPWAFGVAALICACGGATDMTPRGDAASPPPRAAGVDELGWLVGSWEGRDKDGTCYAERWFEPVAGTVAGATTHVRRDGATAREIMRVHVGDDGTLELVVMVDGFAADRFRWVAGAEGRARFARGGDDFPSLVTYTRDGDALSVQLSGHDEGATRVIPLEAHAGRTTCGRDLDPM